MKKVRFLSVLTACAMLCGMAAAMPEIPERASLVASAGKLEQLTYGNKGDYIEIMDCDDSATEIVIPAEIEGLPVTGIDYSAFYGCADLTNITIPDSVNVIGNEAFRGCSSLTSIIIPDGVKYIGNGVFYDCTSLSSVTIPSSVVHISGGAFTGCTSLSSIIIPEGVEEIDYSAFSRCTNLASVTIPNSVTEILPGAFGECTSLTDIIIPDGITCIRSNTFYGCTSLTSVTIPDSVTHIDSGAFSDCTSLSNITIPDSVINIGGNVFEGTALFDPNVDYGVIYIDNWAVSCGFSYDSEIVLLDGTKGIAGCVFDGYPDIISITIPDSVAFIGDSAFHGCFDLADVYYAGTEEEWDAIIIDESNDPLLNATIHYNYTPEPALPLADLNGDDTIDANDASMLLVAAANAGSGADSGLTEAQIAAADLNADGQFDASDASLILMYAAYAGAGGELDITGFLAQL